VGCGESLFREESHVFQSIDSERKHAFNRWNPKEHSAIDKVGCGKLNYSREILFRVKSHVFATLGEGSLKASETLNVT